MLRNPEKRTTLRGRGSGAILRPLNVVVAPRGFHDEASSKRTMVAPSQEAPGKNRLATLSKNMRLPNSTASSSLQNPFTTLTANTFAKTRLAILAWA